MFLVAVDPCSSGNRVGGSGEVVVVYVSVTVSRGILYTRRSAWIELIFCSIVN